MSSKISNNVLALVSLLLFIGTVIFLSVEMIRIDRLENELNQERVISEGLLSEKLLTEKERDKLGSLLKDNQSLNAQWAIRFDSASAGNRLKEVEIRQLKANLQRGADERSLYKKLQLKNAEHERESLRLQNIIADAELTRALQDERLSTLTEENQALRSKIESTPPVVRQMLIETLKKSSRLTPVAKRTRKITCTIEVNEMGMLTCEIINPSGNSIKTTEKTLTIVRDTHDLKKITITFTPPYKLEAGIYTVKILSREKLAGSLQVRLR